MAAAEEWAQALIPGAVTAVPKPWNKLEQVGKTQKIIWKIAENVYALIVLSACSDVQACKVSWKTFGAKVPLRSMSFTGNN